MEALTHARIREGLDGLGRPAWVKSHRGRYLAASCALGRWVGASPDRMVGSPDSEFWPSSTVRSFHASDNDALAHGTPVVVSEPGKDEGTTVVTLKLPLWRAGRPIGTVGCFFQTSRPIEDRLPFEYARFLDLAGGLLAEEGVQSPPDGSGPRMVVGLAPFPGPVPGWLETVRASLIEGFRNPVSVSALAARVDRHPSHVGRAFRRSFGEPIHAFVRLLRVSWASVELASTGRAIGAIGVAAGYADQSHFVRDFRRVMGMTPTAYRTSRVEDRVFGTGRPGPPTKTRVAADPSSPILPA